MTHLRKTVLSLELLAAMTASAQDNFSAKANALRQQYQTEAAKTRAAGEASDTMASFVVICKPTLIYTKDGKEYTAVIPIELHF